MAMVVIEVAAYNNNGVSCCILWLVFLGPVIANRSSICSVLVIQFIHIFNTVVVGRILGSDFVCWMCCDCRGVWNLEGS